MKLFKKILPSMFGMFLLVSPVNAEIQTYQGIGEYVMSDFETLDLAKERAKSRAERNAQEQAGVWVDSYLKVDKGMVVEDEINVITGGIMSVENVRYSVEPVTDSILSVKATLTAKIDSDKIDNWLTKTVDERDSLVAENRKLLQKNQEAERQIEDLKAQLATVTTVTQRNELKIEITQVDTQLTAYQKIYDAHNLIIAGKYSEAVDLLTEAIAIDPENSDGYFQRACAYAKLNRPLPMIADLNEVIKLEPDNSIAYYDRGLAYKEIGRLNFALDDFAKAVELDSDNQLAQDQLESTVQLIQMLMGE